MNPKSPMEYKVAYDRYVARCQALDQNYKTFRSALDAAYQLERSKAAKDFLGK